MALTWRPSFLGGAAADHVRNVTGSVNESLPLSEATSVSFDGVPGGTYTLSVSASNAAGTSTPSNAVTVTVPGPCSGAPLAPAGFLAYRVGATIYAVWDPPASGPAPTQYHLTVSGAFNASFTTAAQGLSGAVGPGSYGLSVAAANACGTKRGQRWCRPCRFRKRFIVDAALERRVCEQLPRTCEPRFLFGHHRDASRQVIGYAFARRP